MDREQRAGQVDLENPSKFALLPARSKAKLRLWRYRTVGCKESWSLHSEGSGWWLRRITVSFGGLYGFTTEKSVAREVIFDKTSGQKVLTELAHFGLVPYREEPNGIDGAEYGVAAGEGPGVTQLSWWSEAPPIWRALASWCQDTVASFEEVLSWDEV